MGGWWEMLSKAALSWLHRGSSVLPFPVLEPMAFLLLILGLMKPKGLVRWLLTASLFYALIWYPLYWTEASAPVIVPDGEQLEALCVSLVDELNASPLRFEPVWDSLGDTVKPARYPEWMRALGISGMLSPWTGEVIVDETSEAAFLPFTCVHELMHLKGIADEGAANIAAWQKCMARGGMYADSARLWALRYAAPMLDADAAERVTGRMGEGLARLFVPMLPAKANLLARLLGISKPTTSYAALVGWLCEGEAPAA